MSAPGRSPDAPVDPSEQSGPTGRPVATAADATLHTPATLFWMALWGGLAYGFTEALLVVALGLVPGGLAWYTGNSIEVIWFAPLFYGLAALPLALAFAGLAATFRRRRWDVVLVALMSVTGAYTCGQIPPAVIASWAIALLAVGIGAQCTRFYLSRRRAAPGFMKRTLPWMAGAVPVLWCVVTAVQSLTERSAMAALPDAPPAAPNVLLIVIDTQRADHFSSYGYARETTPRLDAFAREGTLFEAAYANSSWTLPSFASMLTGRLPQEHRAGVMRRPYLDRELPTMAEEFRRNGYATGGFVANGWWCGRQTRIDRGFIRYEDFYGNVGDAVVRTQLGRYYGTTVRGWLGEEDVLGRKRVGDINREFLSWLEGIGERRFFAMLNYVDVHAPYVPPPPFRGRFSNASGRGSDKSEINIGAIHDAMPEFTAEQFDAMRDAYDESLLSVDAGFGDLIDDLRRRGILDETIVIITSDHGESFGEQGMVWHGHSLHLEQVRVPLIVRFPSAVAAGVREATPVDLSRLAASVAAMAGLPGAPFGDALFPGAPGPLLAEDAVADAAVARRSQVPGPWPTSRASLTAVISERWLLVLEDGQPAELFDLAADPKGLQNRVHLPEHAGVIEDLRARASAEW